MGETTNGEGTGATDAAGSNPAASSSQPSQQPIQTAPIPQEKIELVDLSKRVVPGQLEDPITPVQKAPLKPVAETDRGVNADIAKILGGVKLPERINPVAPEVKSTRSYDTSLVTDPAVTTAERAKNQGHVLEAARAVKESLPSRAPKTADDVRALHTLKDDLQDVVRNKKISLVRAVALEEEKKYRPSISPEEELSARPKPSRAPIVLTLILFLFGAGVLGATYYILQDRAIEAEEPLQSEILFAERTIPLDVGLLAPADIRREIAGARGAGGLPLGAIMQILPARQGPDGSGVPLTFGEFMRAIDAHPPEELVRALGTVFFFGIHTVDENAPAFVVPVLSYERAFAGMLAWERTMNSDLAPMFTAVPTQTVGPDGVLVERKFGDDIIQNFDVRVLRDESGVVQLYYSFPTRNLLIIAESQYSFTELLSRLRADRRL